MKLAINGGTKAVKHALPATPGHNARKEISALKRLLEKGRFGLARGECNLAVRKDAAHLLGVKYCLPVSSGTAAVHTALAALDIGPGDEVITSPCTDYGTVAGIFQLGATVVFADLAPDSICIDPRQVEEKITRRTRVILPVHNAGIPADMAPILRTAKKHGVKVVEDCAQAWGARYRNKYVGTLGDVGVFSTNESKHIVCGEGGIICCRSKKIYEECELFSDKCYDRSGTGRSPYIIALNYRMSEINAVIALQQLKLVPNIATRRHRVGEALRHGIEQIPGIRPFKVPAKSFVSYWFLPLWLDENVLRVSRETFVKALQAEGVRVWYGPQLILRWEIFQKLNRSSRAFRTYRPVGLEANMYRVEDYPNAVWLSRDALAIYPNEAWTKQNIRQVLNALEKVSSWYQRRK